MIFPYMCTRHNHGHLCPPATSGDSKKHKGPNTKGPNTAARSPMDNQMNMPPVFGLSTTRSSLFYYQAYSVPICESAKGGDLRTLSYGHRLCPIRSAECSVVSGAGWKAPLTQNISA